MKLLNNIILLNILFILINSDCTPDDENIVKLDKIRDYSDCERRVTSQELQENNAFRCCYIHYETETKNVEADVHTCILITHSQYNSIKDFIRNYEDKYDLDIYRLDCSGFTLKLRLLILLSFIFIL